MDPLSLLLTLGSISFCVALILTPLCRRIAARYNWTDCPDQFRKFHATPTPRIGGVPIFVACATSLGILPLLSLHWASQTIEGDLNVVRRLCLAATIILVAGILDDLIGLVPWQKLGAQVIAAVIVVWSGIRINTVGPHHLPSWLATSFTVTWLVGCTNAFNLIDGVDGLATGVGLVATTIMLIAALLHHDVAMAVAMVPLIGALGGFLRYNFSPASIFLGDSGSLLIGFLVAFYSIWWTQKADTTLGVTAPLIALSIPLLDTCLAVIRRYLRYAPIFDGDHSHIHHKLLAIGLTPRQTVALLSVVSGVCGGFALLQSVAPWHIQVSIITLLFAAVCMVVEYLGYTELAIARRLIRAGTFRRQLNAELLLSAFREDLTAAATQTQCWEVLRHAYGKFGFSGIRFRCGRQLYADDTNGDHIANTWTVHMTIAEDTYVTLSRCIDNESPPVTARFADTIGTILGSKTSRMRETATVDVDHPIAAGRAHVVNGSKPPLGETVPPASAINQI